MTNRSVIPRYCTEAPSTSIFVGDCRKILPWLCAGLFHLIFADPPFNIGVDYGRSKDRRSKQDYLAFTRSWLRACIRLLSPHGSLWVNIPDEWAAEVAVFLKSQGLHLVNWCVWHYRFGQCQRSKFTASKVHALYFARDRKRRIWNPASILVDSDRATRYGDKRTLLSKTPNKRVPLDVWYGKNWGRIQGNNRERRHGHPNQLPELYLERVIRACSNPGDLVLDPFLGSGTTLTVARALGRQSIGIELNPEFAASAFERIIDGPVRF